MKQSRQILAIIIIILFFNLSFAETPFQKSDDELSTLIQRVRTGIVAVGTYHFKTKPMIKFFGTGFAIAKGNRIVTNHHVVATIKKNNSLFNLRVFHKNLPIKGIKAIILAEDEFHDLAILEIEGAGLPPLPMGGKQRVEEGHRIAFTGYPIGFILGLHPTTHIGIISAIAPIILPSPTAKTINGGLIKYLKEPFDVFQIDAVAYPGNSGSPVYRLATGKIVGVINMVFIKGKKEYILKDPTGITYAIPVEFVHKLNRSIQ